MTTDSRGVILAGGHARRFGGGPKGLARIGGHRILDILVETMRSVFDTPPLLIANDPEAHRWHPDLEVVSDRRPGAGALGGLYTAVAETGGRAICVAWDMPFVPAALLAHLAGAATEWDVVIPASVGRRGVEPMCGRYGPACRLPMEAALDREDLRAIAFHDAVKTCILPLDDVRRFGDPSIMFFNVNTHDDLLRAEHLWQQHGSSR